MNFKKYVEIFVSTVELDPNKLNNKKWILKINKLFNNNYQFNKKIIIIIHKIKIYNNSNNNK